MCGIGVDGENHFMIAPRPGGSFTYAKASYQSIYGLVESGWERTEKGYSLRICIPANTAATVVLPNGKKINLLPGEARFEEIC